MSEGKDHFPTNPIDETSKELDADVLEQEEETVRIGQIASILDGLSEQKKTRKKTAKKRTESVFEIVAERNPEPEPVKEQKPEPVKEQKPEAKKAESEEKSEEAKTEVKKSEKKADTEAGKKEAEAKEKSVAKKKTEKKKPGKKTAELIRQTALQGAKVAADEDLDEDADDEDETSEAEEDAEEAEEQRLEEEEVETQLARTRKWIRDKIQKNRMLVLIIGIVLLILAVYYLVHSQTYENISVIETKTIQGAVNCYYAEFDDGFIKYSQDGLAYLSKDGSEKWNLAYQIAEPFIAKHNKTGVVADKQGQSIVVFQKSGVIGQIETTLPIEKVTVSKQGIVCAVLQNNDSAMVMCYDLVGNVLVEHKTAFSGTGYPMDVALSEDGENLMVTYLYVSEGIITTKVMFYNFGDAGHNISDHQVAQFEYPGTISASCFYLDKNVCVMVGDDKLVYYKGTEEPEEIEVIELDKEIKNLCYDNANIGLVLKNGKESGYEARMYDLNGKVKMSANFTGEYNNVKMCDDQMLMYDGKRCSIVLENGVQKFQGELENIVLEIVPESGVNKYLLVDQDGFKRIRLVK